VEDQEADEADAGAGAAEGGADAAVDMSMFDLSVKKKKKPKKPKKETEEAAAGTAASGDNACDYSYETLLDRIQVHPVLSSVQSSKVHSFYSFAPHNQAPLGL
jgi:hypothetical protein